MAASIARLSCAQVNATPWRIAGARGITFAELRDCDGIDGAIVIAPEGYEH
jgi:hypothetical protein